MIDHERALELAATAPDFALGEADRAELQTHLDGCSACRALAAGFGADARAIAYLPTLDAPEDLRARVLDAAATSGEVGEVGEPQEPRERAGGPRLVRLIPSRYRRPAAMVAAAAVIVALIGGVLIWSPRPDAGTDVAAASASPGSPVSSPGPAGSSPIPSPGPGSQLAGGTWSPVADLTAEDVQGGVVGLASGFRLESLDGTPAADLAARLTVDPPITFAVVAEADGRSAQITPSEPLTAGTVYRFTLTADDGRTLDSWAFQAHQPLRIVETLPGDTQTDVPTNTGVEVTFDQDGVVDAASHMTIEPRIDGRFEQHGRTLAFVPAKRLKAATVFTVTVTRGIAVGGTGEILESDVRFRFETAAAAAAGKVRTTFQFSDDVFESATADAATIGVWVFQDWSDGEPTPKPPKTARVDVHRLPDLESAVAAFRQVREAPQWAQRAPVDPISTKSLDLVVSFDAGLREADGFMWFRLPRPLPAAWYVLTVRSGTRPVQAILQSTDIAGYLVVSGTKTLVWANDLASGGPVAGAAVAADGVDLGRTDPDGTRVVATPAALLPTDGACTNRCVPVVTVRAGDRAAFLPANGRRQFDELGYGGYGAYGAKPTGYWSTFDTDRTLYRRVDTVNAWGVVRDRDTGEVPRTVTVRVFAVNGEGGSGEGAPLSTTEAHPNAIGAFSASLALDDVAEGDYVAESSIGDDIVGYRWFRVDRILKPAYRLEVVTGRRVYFQGDQIRVTATATFYEGSPVPGVPLRLDGFLEKSFTTGKTGTATARTTVRFDADDQGDSGQGDIRSVAVTPARAEEGSISGASRDIVAFRSSWLIDASTSIADDRVLVTGSLHAVDRDRLEREIAAGSSIWELDAAGGPIAGKTVAATFTELIPYRVQTGTQYDFIEKKVVPVYDYGSTERAAGTVRVTTGSDGSFTASVKAAAGHHTYRVRLRATDPEARAARWTGWASDPETQDDSTQPSLVRTSDPSSDAGDFGVGEPIDLTMHDPGRPADGTDRYLFYTAQAGLRDAAVQSSARYQGTFADSAPPVVWITGVRFTGKGYVESPGFRATFRRTDRELNVSLNADAARYAPGSEVTLTVTTRDRTGQPIPASVVLRGVDEKLFTIGGAYPSDPLGELYQEVGSGIVATYRSHHPPEPNGYGADTGGGGGDESLGREDFRDWVLFKQVDTGQDGRAIVTFRVADDLTSWRISASAFGAGLLAGEASIGIPVGLPFFVDSTIAPEYLVSDRPAIGLRAFGTALKAGAAVTFAVDSDSLGLHVAGLHAKAFETATVSLPKLTAGNHRVTITATTGSGASARRDVVTRTIKVVSSRLARTRATYVEPAGATSLDAGGGRVDVIVSDAGASRYLPLLLDLADVDSARLERTLAAAIAGTLAKDRFGLGDVVTSTGFDGSTYQTADGGVAILPNGGNNLQASALAALVAPDRFDASLGGYLSSVAGNGKETRERRMIALAGLGGLHAPVLPRIREAAATPNLTVRELLWLGLGAAALGDAETARSIAGGLEDRYGEVNGDLARLRVGDSAADITEGTALMAMLAAATGDALASRFWSYVQANQGDEATYALHAVGYVTRLLERGAPRTASFAYTIDGKREAVELAAGETFHISVSHEQFGALTIEPVAGQIGVTTSWQETVKPSSYAKDPDLRITRRMIPSGRIGPASLVRVDLTVTIGRKAPSGCHLVTDLVPSGLVAVGNLQGWLDEGGESSGAANVTYPYAQVGQVVSFCADRGTRKAGAVLHLRYFARVVTSGTYTWEPSVVSSRTGTNRAALTKATVVTIR
jgi:hypothetical protein